MRKFVIIALIMLGIGVIGATATASMTGMFSLETVPYLEEESVAADGVENIKVNVSSPDVHVFPTNTDHIHVKLSGDVSEKVKDKYRFQVKKEGNTVSIIADMKDMSFFVGLPIGNLTLEVEVPEKDYNSIALHSSSGEIHVEKLQANELITEASSGDIQVDQMSAKSHYDLEASSGNINVKDSKAQTFNLVVSSGDIHLKNVDGNVMAKSSSGEIALDNQEVTGNMSFEASSGDVTVSFAQEPQSLAIDFEGSSGDGVVNLEGLSYDEKKEDRVVGKIGSGQYELVVRTSSGDFTLN